MTFPDLMSSPYHCPRCQSPRVYETESTIYCPHCKLTFDKKMMDELEDEDMMANEELEGIIRDLDDTGYDLSRL
jgi:uncharacterized Zn finger protein (UPF0148 family)